MNKSRQILFKLILVLLCFSVVETYGQKQSKSYNESFKVNNDAVLTLNTSHADIEFETWDKNEVVIEATIELEGATDEEAKAYFEDGAIKIMGNSSAIEISTGAENLRIFRHSIGDLHNIEIPNIEHFLMEIPEMLEIPDVGEIMAMPEMVEILEFTRSMPMPPMPPTAFDFDYQEYRKDGDKYMKKWQKKFEKDFSEEYQEEMEEWSKEMEKRQEEMEAHREERKEANEERREEMEEQRQIMRENREAMLEEREEQREAMLEEREEQREAMLEQREIQREQREAIRENRSHHTFYSSEEGKSKNYKIKKTIKIKMPKSTKLKMNVRHGEVKLAENTINIDATLSYTRLLASSINGNNTIINASYSPISVKEWNYGSLKADYSENVDLEEVKELIFSGTSSNVTIDNLLKKAIINNNLGALNINTVSNNFSVLDVSVEHGELEINLPTTAYVIYINGKSSEVNYPKELVVDTSDSFGNLIIKGYHLNKNDDKSIVVNSKYSEVVLK